MITGTQIRAARALLGWSQEKLAEASAVSSPTVKRIEGRGDTLGGRVTTIERIRIALEAAGIVFINSDDEGGCGVRLGRRDRSGLEFKSPAD